MTAAHLHSTEEPLERLPRAAALGADGPQVPLASLRSADLGARQAGMAQLGRSVGNGALQRLAAPAVQRDDEGEELDGTELRSFTDGLSTFAEQSTGGGDATGGDPLATGTDTASPTATGEGFSDPIPLNGGNTGGVTTSRGTVSTYAVTGNLAQAATQIGARTEAGKCWVDGGSVGMNDDGAGKVASVSGSPVINVELPAWDGLASAPQVQQTEWNRFMTALQAHEEKHATIFEKAFASYNGTVGKSTAEFDKIQPKMEADEAKFDTDTDHGKKPAPGTALQSNLGEMEKVK